ncbi:LLM class flavin-dependent oxidoreductase [Streptomyces acidiscabies]|uniref:LLM class flavin-dependent oxidoreductase n=1 Tax=Streptomyces acidiscabies TaxID=42234 RepID=UPI0038F5EE31
MTVHVGAQLPVNSIPGYRDDLDLAAVARHAEDLGLDSVWAGDRLAAPYPTLDPSLVLATAAAATSRIQVGYGVLLLALRSAAWAAKQVGTLQRLSGGRTVLGVGVGTGDPQEWAAAGVSPRGRGRRTERLLELLPGLLAGERTALTDLPGSPSVALNPAVPVPEIWIGGGSEQALRRVVSHGQGWLAAMKPPKEVARCVGRLGELAAEQGVPAPRVSMHLHVRLLSRADHAASSRVADRLTAQYGMPRALSGDVGVAGTPAQIAERLREYGDAGAERFVLVPFGEDGDDPFRQYELFAGARELLARG